MRGAVETGDYFANTFFFNKTDKREDEFLSLFFSISCTFNNTDFGLNSSTATDAADAASTNNRTEPDAADQRCRRAAQVDARCVSPVLDRTARHTHTHTNRQINTETDTQTHRQTETDTHTHTHTHTHTDKHRDTQTDSRCEVTDETRHRQVDCFSRLGDSGALYHLSVMISPI